MKNWKPANNIDLTRIEENLPRDKRLVVSFHATWGSVYKIVNSKETRRRSRSRRKADDTY
jgi:hypothetical protein